VNHQKQDDLKDINYNLVIYLNNGRSLILLLKFKSHTSHLYN